MNQPTPAFCLVDIHPDRRRDIVQERGLVSLPHVVLTDELDAFGNRMRRFITPGGETTISLRGVIADSSIAEARDTAIATLPIEKLPADVMMYLNGSRYCETDKLAEVAWKRFGHLPRNGGLVQAICDFTSEQITFDYQRARATRTAFEAFEECAGVCRDFAPSRDYALPVLEYSGTLRQWPSWRHRCALQPNADGFQCLVRGLS